MRTSSGVPVGRPVHEVVDALGSAVLGVAVKRARLLESAIRDVVLYVPEEDMSFPAHSLLLWPGRHDAETVAAHLDRLAPLGVAAVAVKSPPDDPRVREAVLRSRIALLSVVEDVSWTHLAALVRMVVDRGSPAEADDDVSGVRGGDLFAVANSLADMVDAPVTIEDPQARVLAYSGGQFEADTARVESILGRRVPDRYTRAIRESGLYHRLAKSRSPVYCDLASIGMRLRAVVAVRAGDEMLGSIWAVVDEPLSPERERALTNAVPAVALHMLRQRVQQDELRRHRSDLVAAVLQGGAAAQDAIGRLGLGEGPLCVVGLQPLAGPGAGADLAATSQRLLDAFDLHLSVLGGRAAAALLGTTVYAVLPAALDDDSPTSRHAVLVSDFVQRAGERTPLIAAIGHVVRGPHEANRSRSDVDQTLRVLRQQGEPGRVCHVGETYLQSLLLRIGDLVDSDGHAELGPVALLVAHDQQQDGVLVKTLTAYLERWGDIRQAAVDLHIHPNTLRYRLRRITELTGLDLEDPDERLSAQLQLRIRRLRSSLS